MIRSHVRSQERPRSQARGIVLSGLMATAVIAAVAVPLVSPGQSAYGRDEAVSVVSLLGDSSVASDRLPTGFPVEAHGDGGIDAASARLLGDAGGSRYWVARDARGQVCLLAIEIADSAQTVASCAPPRLIETEGAPLAVSGRWTSAHLVPDSVDLSALRSDVVILGPNLIVFAPGADPAAAITLPRDHGESGPAISVGLSTSFE